MRNLLWRIRRGKAARWVEANPVLDDGELGFERDTNFLKVGNGVNRWTQLPYVQAPAAGEDDGPDFVLLYENGKV